MKAISVYALTREQNIHHLQKLERQLSERDYFLKIKEWELNSMKGLVKQLEGHMKEVYALRFFYSFQIPKLGKEFDLLQIKEDQILNLELKSGIVSDEAIRKQLIQNRYYLSVLGRTIRSYQQPEPSGSPDQSRSYRGGGLGTVVSGSAAGER